MAGGWKVAPFYDFLVDDAAQPRFLYSMRFPISPINYQFLEVREPATDPWVFKKTLEASNAVDLKEIFLDRKIVNEHIMPHLDADTAGRVRKCKGEAIIVVRDEETGTAQELCFARLRRTGAYILQGEFVRRRRRELMEGDTFGMYWDEGSSSFLFFTILSQPPPPAAAALLPPPAPASSEASGVGRMDPNINLELSL